MTLPKVPVALSSARPTCIKHGSASCVWPVRITSTWHLRGDPLLLDAEFSIVKHPAPIGDGRIGKGRPNRLHGVIIQGLVYGRLIGGFGLQIDSVTLPGIAAI